MNLDFLRRPLVSFQGTTLTIGAIILLAVAFWYFRRR